MNLTKYPCRSLPAFNTSKRRGSRGSRRVNVKYMLDGVPRTLRKGGLTHLRAQPSEAGLPEVNQERRVNRRFFGARPMIPRHRAFAIGKPRRRLHPHYTKFTPHSQISHGHAKKIAFRKKFHIGLTYPVRILFALHYLRKVENYEHGKLFSNKPQQGRLLR